MSFRVTVAQQAEQLVGFENMTFPAFARLLTQVGSDPTVVAVTAHQDDVPAGLALAQLLPEKGDAVLRSIFVQPEFRRQGLALQLLTEIEQFLRDLLVGRVVGSYARNPAVDGLLLRAGWIPPQPSMFLFHVPMDGFRAFAASPLMRPTTLGPGQEIVPWGQITPQDHAGIQEAIERFEVAPGLQPRSELDTLNHDLSLVFKVDGTVYSWLLIHNLSPVRIRVTSLYARPDNPAKGIAMRLVVEMVRKRCALVQDQPETEVTWGCPAAEPMAAFSLRRLVPLVPGISVRETLTTGKPLS